MSSSEYFGKKVVRPNHDGSCPPGTIRTDEGCLPVGRRKTPRGFQDPDYPIYCGLEKEVPCLPSREFSLPDPAPLPLPDPPPGKGIPQGNTELTITCPAPTTGTITIPENFFVQVPAYSNDPAINTANEVAAKAAAEAEALAFAESTLLCIHSSEVVSEVCPEGAGSAQNLPAGYLRAQVPYLDSPDNAQITALTEAAEALAFDNLQCYRSSEAKLYTCTGEGGIFPSLGDAQVLIQANSLQVAEGFIRRLIDIDPESVGVGTPTQEDVDALRDSYAATALLCRMVNAAKEELCLPAKVDVGGPALADVPPQDPGSILVEEGRFATELVHAENSLAELEAIANSLKNEVAGFITNQLVCFYGNLGSASACPEPEAPDSDYAFLLPESATNSFPSGTFIQQAADLSQTAADTAAQAAHDAAQANLTTNCLYGNLRYVDECTGLGQTVDSRDGVAEAGEIVQAGGWDNIQTQTQSLAAARKFCLYENEVKTGSCPEALGDTFIGNIGTVAAGTIISTVSLDDANKIAQSIADATTLCLYCNGEVGLGVCLDNPTTPERTGIPVVNGQDGFEGNVGEVGLCQIINTTGGGDANNSAKALADSLTLCLYSNTIEGVGFCKERDTPEGPLLDYAINTPGFVPIGTVISPIGIDAANAAAKALAEAQAVCVLQSEVNIIGGGGGAIGVTGRREFAQEPNSCTDPFQLCPTLTNGCNLAEADLGLLVRQGNIILRRDPNEVITIPDPLPAGRFNPNNIRHVVAWVRFKVGVEETTKKVILGAGAEIFVHPIPDAVDLSDKVGAIYPAFRPETGESPGANVWETDVMLGRVNILKDEYYPPGTEDTESATPITTCFRMQVEQFHIGHFYVDDFFEVTDENGDKYITTSPATGGSNKHPFQIVPGKDAQDNPVAYVRFGTVSWDGDETPTVKIGSKELDEYDYTQNELPGLITTGTGGRTTWYIHFETGSGSASIKALSGPSSDANNAYQYLGSATTDGEGGIVVNSDLTGSQEVAFCGKFSYWGSV